jgi:hypothetical protein
VLVVFFLSSKNLAQKKKKKNWMKLKVRQTGLVTKELEVNIRNSSATMANVRAAIAILFKLDPHSFKMVKGSSASSSSAVADFEDSTKLSTSGLAEGDLIVLVAKRSRSDDGAADLAAEAAEVASAVAAAAAAAVVPNPATPAAAASVAAPPPTPATTSRSGTAVAAAAAALATVDRPTIPQKRLRKATTSDRSTAPHIINSADQEDPFLAQRMEADDAEARAAIRDDIDDDDVSGNDDDEEGDDEEMDEQDEIQEMVSHLLSVPNILDMRRQFLENPQAVLQQIQGENPRLFQLISSHNQAFLDLVENETLLEALREEQEAEEAYIGGSDEEGDDEEFDEEDETALHELILNALGAAAAEEEQALVRRGGRGGGGTGATTAGNSAATSVTLGRNATQMLDSLRSTAGPNDIVQSGELNHSESVAPSPALPRQRGSIPLVISEDDQQKIEGLTHLGFTTEQCTAAFFLSNRSIERAANLLFENPPSM